MSRRFALPLLIGLLAVAAAALFFWPRPAPKPPLVVGELPPFCRDMSFEGVVHAVCELNPKAHAIFTARADAAGRPYGSLDAFDKAMAADGIPVLLAMNAGMYHEGFGPVGLFVEAGRQEAPLNLADGEGNFFLKPNGVFFVRKDGSAGVLETAAYAAAHADAAPDVDHATQSGPMLVIGGKIHPRFEPDGASRFIRNGVGVRADGTVVLAISRQPVSLGSFARLFLDDLSCPDALFLDGAISTLSDGKRVLVGGRDPVGPILAVRERGP